MRNCDGICEFYREMYIGLDPEKQRADELHMENMAKGRLGAVVTSQLRRTCKRYREALVATWTEDFSASCLGRALIRLPELQKRSP